MMSCKALASHLAVLLNRSTFTKDVARRLGPPEICLTKAILFLYLSELNWEVGTVEGCDGLALGFGGSFGLGGLVTREDG